MSESDENPAAEALDAIRKVQANSAIRLSKGSWTYDLIYALLLAAMIASCAMTTPLGGIIFTGCLALLGLHAFLWARRTGMWISGTTPPRARWVAYGIGLCSVPLIVINLVWARESGSVAIPVVTSTGAFLIALVGSRLWWHVYRKESGL